MKKRTPLNLFNPIDNPRKNNEINKKQLNKSQSQVESNNEMKLLTKLELDQTYKNTNTCYNQIKNTMHKDNVKNIFDDYKKPVRNKSAVITRPESPKNNFKKLKSVSVIKNTNKNLNEKPRTSENNLRNNDTNNYQNLNNNTQTYTQSNSNKAKNMNSDKIDSKDNNTILFSYLKSSKEINENTMHKHGLKRFENKDLHQSNPFNPKNNNESLRHSKNYAKNKPYSFNSSVNPTERTVNPIFQPEEKTSGIKIVNFDDIHDKANLHNKDEKLNRKTLLRRNQSTETQVTTLPGGLKKSNIKDDYKDFTKYNKIDYTLKSKNDYYSNIQCLGSSLVNRSTTPIRNVKKKYINKSHIFEPLDNDTSQNHSGICRFENKNNSQIIKQSLSQERKTNYTTTNQNNFRDITDNVRLIAENKNLKFHMVNNIMKEESNKGKKTFYGFGNPSEQKKDDKNTFNKGNKPPKYGRHLKSSIVI